ncbi:MAG: hypothetical protein KC619_04715 [Myxococcales bacterium]|nr:hypothetical protein [Myxococcales bacterium]
MSKRLWVPILVLVAGGCAAEAVRVEEITEGLAHPESALYDAARNEWLVSSQGEMGVPGDGFVTRLGADGEVVTARLATGLDDPKGMGMVGHTLYVADVDHVAAIDLDDPSHITRIPVPEAVFLNDLAVDDATGDIYVSDSFGNAIVRVREGEAEVWLRDPALETPNGLHVEGHTLWVVSIGPDPDPATFQTSAPGRVLRVDLDERTVEPVGPRLGGLDGIARDGDGWLISDTFVGLYRVDDAGEAELLAPAEAFGLSGVADFGFDPVRRRVAVPELFGTEVSFLAIP